MILTSPVPALIYHAAPAINRLVKTNPLEILHFIHVNEPRNYFESWIFPKMVNITPDLLSFMEVHKYDAIISLKIKLVCSRAVRN